MTGVIEGGPNGQSDQGLSVFFNKMLTDKYNELIRVVNRNVPFIFNTIEKSMCKHNLFLEEQSDQRLFVCFLLIRMDFKN